jgi:type IV pilus assembly protein PilA
VPGLNPRVSLADHLCMYRRETDSGFTLIELLVVIIVIGILAAIAIPSYLRQREKAWRGQAINDMRNAGTAIESFSTENDGSFAALNGATEGSPLLAAEGFRGNDQVSLVVVSDVHEYCVRGRHAKLSSVEYLFRSGTGVLEVGAPGAIPC